MEKILPESTPQKKCVGTNAFSVVGSLWGVGTCLKTFCILNGVSHGSTLFHSNLSSPNLFSDLSTNSCGDVDTDSASCTFKACTKILSSQTLECAHYIYHYSSTMIDGI